MEKYLQDLSNTLQMLPLDDRAYLAHVLLESLRTGDLEVSAAELAEDERRYREAVDHPETTMSWDELKDRLDARAKAN